MTLQEMNEHRMKLEMHFQLLAAENTAGKTDDELVAQSARYRKARHAWMCADEAFRRKMAVASIEDLIEMSKG